LERDEWGKMASSLNAAKGDKDGDGNITLDEFSAHFAEQNSRGGSSSSSSSASSGGSGGGFGGGRSGGRFSSSSSRPSSNPNSGRPTRFLSPIERLPEGLPSWFSRNDQNADGQISMAEYSRSWTEAQVREFARYDANSDGMITPAECLAIERR
jgi:Ca2+-binding EF-hand superfamily protein